MKKTLLIVAGAMLLAGASKSYAQDFGGGMPPQGAPRVAWQQGQNGERGERPSTDEIAARQTDRMKEQLALDEKQYKKVLKLNRQQLSYGSQSTGRPMGGPGMGGGMGRPGMGGGMPPMGGRGGDMSQMGGQMGDMPQMGESQSQEQIEKSIEEQEKRRESYNKKLAKILTPEQYSTWMKIENERRRAEFRNTKPE